MIDRDTLEFSNFQSKSLTFWDIKILSRILSKLGYVLIFGHGDGKVENGKMLNVVTRYSFFLSRNLYFLEIFPRILFVKIRIFIFDHSSFVW